MRSARCRIFRPGVLKEIRLTPLSICVASILRITYLWYIVFDDVSGEYFKFLLQSCTYPLSGTIAIPSIWTSLEPGLGIVCGCLPTFPSLFRHWSELYHSKRSGSGLRLFSLTHSRFWRSPDVTKDQQSLPGEDSTADPRSIHDIEMQPQKTERRH